MAASGSESGWPTRGSSPGLARPLPGPASSSGARPSPQAQIATGSESSLSSRRGAAGRLDRDVLLAAGRASQCPGGPLGHGAPFRELTRPCKGPTRGHEGAPGRPHCQCSAVLLSGSTHCHGSVAVSVARRPRWQGPWGRPAARVPASGACGPAASRYTRGQAGRGGLSVQAGRRASGRPAPRRGRRQRHCAASWARCARRLAHSESPGGRLSSQLEGDSPTVPDPAPLKRRRAPACSSMPAGGPAG